LQNMFVMTGALGRWFRTLKAFRIQKSVIAWSDDNAMILPDREAMEMIIEIAIFQSIRIFLNLKQFLQNHIKLKQFIMAVGIRILHYGDQPLLQMSITYRILVKLILTWRLAASQFQIFEAKGKRKGVKWKTWSIYILRTRKYTIFV
jgi:hypothetical protein